MRGEQLDGREMKRREEPTAIWQAERCDGGAFEYIGAGTVSDVAPAATSQRNSCEMSYRYKREQNSRGYTVSPRTLPRRRPLGPARSAVILHHARS